MLELKFSNDIKSYIKKWQLQLDIYQFQLALKELCSSNKGSVQKTMDLSMYGSEPSTHPLNMENKIKRLFVFWAF